MFEKNINLIDIQTIAVSLIVLVVSILRLIPHVNNFSPIIALAIFGALHYKSKNLSYIIPLLALWFSDLLINNFIYKNCISNYKDLAEKNLDDKKISILIMNSIATLKLVIKELQDI